MTQEGDDDPMCPRGPHQPEHAKRMWPRMAERLGGLRSSRVGAA